VLVSHMHGDHVGDKHIACTATTSVTSTSRRPAAVTARQPSSR
jgi:L-ascorbate metabolism protein UlaG (beta-lactamase superfamily)